MARAEEHLGAAVAINPTLMSLRYNLAQLREKQGRLAEAAELYLREIRDSPKSYKALYNLSRVYRLMGREDEEYETLKKTIEVEPEFPIAYFYLARILLRRGGRLRGGHRAGPEGDRAQAGPGRPAAGLFPAGRPLQPDRGPAPGPRRTRGRARPRRRPPESRNGDSEVEGRSSEALLPSVALVTTAFSV